MAWDNIGLVDTLPRCTISTSTTRLAGNILCYDSKGSRQKASACVETERCCHAVERHYLLLRNKDIGAYGLIPTGL